LADGSSSNYRFSSKDIAHVLAIAIISVIFLKYFVLDFYLVRSDSMADEYPTGKRLLISRIYYTLGFPPYFLNELKLNNIPLYITYKSPKKYDVIVFLLEDEYIGKSGQIKRIVGIPGDKIAIINDPQLARNPFIQTYAMAKHTDPSRIMSMWKLPKKGEIISLTNENFHFYKSLIENENNSIEIIDGEFYINKKKNEKYKFCTSHYFVIGDNRSKSYDSRNYGPIPFTSIIGSPILKL